MNDARVQKVLQALVAHDDVERQSSNVYKCTCGEKVYVLRGNDTSTLYQEHELHMAEEIVKALYPEVVYGDPCPVCQKDGWPAGSAGNARRIHELSEHEGDPRIKPRWRS